MGETVLVMMALTPEKIAGGEALLRRLDQEGISVVSAFWLFREEPNDWKLMLAMPRADDDWPLLHRKIRSLLEEMGVGGMKVSDVAIVEPRHRDVERYGYQVWRGRLPKTAIYHLDCGTRYIYRFLPRRLRG
jgi:hypothetical protein